jgi:hypothetical protein
MPAVSPRILFRPLLTSGMIGKDNASNVYIIIDSEQSEVEQCIALWHETLHLLGLKDEDQVEALAKRLADACPEILSHIRATDNCSHAPK